MASGVEEESSRRQRLPWLERLAGLRAGRRPGVALYQDMVVAGRTVARGSRDCESRWEAMAPHLPAEAVLLDVGSNFGWFGLKACAESDRRIVVSVEADESSATLQRRMLASHDHRRVILLTRRADVAMASAWVAGRQRFHAVFCLSVLHWLRDHEPFLRMLGECADRIFIEHPDPREAGAGIQSVRAQIGQIGDYLARVFPNRPGVLLARLPSHRNSVLARELWMVGPPHGATTHGPVEIDAELLLRMSTSWPSRNWWRNELSTLSDGGEPELPGSGNVVVTPVGLRLRDGSDTTPKAAVKRLQRLVRGVPDRGLYTTRDWMRHRARRFVALKAVDAFRGVSAITRTALRLTSNLQSK